MSEPINTFMSRGMRVLLLSCFIMDQFSSPQTSLKRAP